MKKKYNLAFIETRDRYKRHWMYYVLCSDVLGVLFVNIFAQFQCLYCRTMNMQDVYVSMHCVLISEGTKSCIFLVYGMVSEAHG